MLTNLDTLFSRLGNTQYLYLLLEPLPLFGLFFGLLFFMVGLYMGQDKCRMVALVVIAISCGSVMLYGNVRQDAMKSIVNSRSSLTVSIKAQTQLRANTKWIFQTVAVVALVALIAGGKLGAIGNYGVLAMGLGAFVFAIWLHMKEAEVYHPNLKERASKSPASRA